MFFAALKGGSEMRYLHDYTRASLETGSIPNDAAAPVVFADMAAILQCIEPRQDSPHGLRVEVMQTIQELLSKGTKGRHIKEPTKPKRPAACDALGLALAA